MPSGIYILSKVEINPCERERHQCGASSVRAHGTDFVPNYHGVDRTSAWRLYYRRADSTGLCLEIAHWPQRQAMLRQCVRVERMAVILLLKINDLMFQLLSTNGPLLR